jgi:putative FmdB family regulatory protein
MPFYRYECVACKSEFRVLRRTDDGTVVSCPQCGSAKTKRLLPRIGVIYKGKGYYSTDYRKTRGEGAARSSSAESTSVADD